MFEIIRRAGPVFFSTSNYIATLLGVALGVLFFGDAYSWWIWAAIVLMFIGLFCVNVIGVYKPPAIACAKGKKNLSWAGRIV